MNKYKTYWGASPDVLGSASPSPGGRPMQQMLHEFRTLVGEILSAGASTALELIQVITQVALQRPTGASPEPSTKSPTPFVDLEPRGVSPHTPASVRMERLLFPVSRNNSILGTPVRQTATASDEEDDRESPYDGYNRT